VTLGRILKHFHIRDTGKLTPSFIWGTLGLLEGNTFISWALGRKHLHIRLKEPVNKSRETKTDQLDIGHSSFSHRMACNMMGKWADMNWHS
jgi:hypothetical protein